MVWLTSAGITGDLFECEADLDCPALWQENSERPHLQEQSRIHILSAADYIIPGHGTMFQVGQRDISSLFSIFVYISMAKTCIG